MVNKPKKALATKETKPFFSRSAPKNLNHEEALEANETQFWAEVEAHSKNLIANLIEAILPISATPNVFNLEKDVDYRILLRDDLPSSYQDNEEYLEKVRTESWNEADIEYVAQELACAYWEIVVKALIDRLSEYNGFEATSLSELKG